MERVLGFGARPSKAQVCARGFVEGPPTLILSAREGNGAREFRSPPAAKASSLL